MKTLLVCYIVGFLFLLKGTNAQVQAHCLGDYTFQKCASSCDYTCEDPFPVCTAECVARCACPLNKPIVLDEDAYTCGTLSECDALVPTPGEGNNNCFFFLFFFLPINKSNHRKLNTQFNCIPRNTTSVFNKRSSIFSK